MDLSWYPYKANEDFTQYEFVSVGPNGNIRKRVTFRSIYKDRYNIGFGDVDMTTDETVDNIITNNGDSRIVLATVASIVYDFTSRNENATLLAVGVTASRNRLYRMGINNHWQAINPQFEVLGFYGGRWEYFEKEKPYEAFLVSRRKM
jgi:hypothetical protein